MANRDKWLSARFRFPEISSEIERLFNELTQQWGPEGVVESQTPSVDFYETEDAFVLEADLPGVKAHEVTVDLEGDELLLRGQRVVEHMEQTGRFYYRERTAGRFLRRISLPEWIDRDEIQAEFSDGVLRVTLPKIRGDAS